MKSEADADDEQREHAEDGLFILLADVVFLLDELGPGQLMRKLEDEFAPARSS